MIFMHFKADGKSSLPPFKCVVPQTQTLNRGDWKAMENEWKKFFNNNPKGEIKIDIQIIYDGTSKRPEGFNVVYYLDGKINTRQFDN